ncbi:ComEA family DNA-binding protein [Georgenia sp. H159]|uniref:ComEA family DNA-binding protein n=1 Tax=Georgenia sp. H159 TaxID=3076115 RepID=UPI002D7735DB|nr:ComEA family DNA-binding protein [Georgenia sp. H159]
MAARTARRGTPDSAARLRALTRRAYTATAGHLDLDEDAGREFDRIVNGERADGGVGTGGAAGTAGRTGTHEGSGTRARSRAGGRSTASTTPGRTRRWAVSGRAAVVLLAVVAALAGAVVARAIALGPSDPVPVPPLVTHAPGAGASTGEVAVGEADGSEVPGAGMPSGVTAAPEGPVGDDRPGTAAGGDPAVVVVHVAGAVVEPGVVRLPAGARVAESIDAAGGAQPEAELAAVNLARPLQDGEQVYVPRVGEARPGAAAGPAGPAAAAGATGPGGEPGEAGVVDLNTADLSALDTLPGVGPAIAQRILEWRETNGPFHSVDELLEVSGIGPTTLERVRERVRV